MALLVEALLLVEEAKDAGAGPVSLVLPYMMNARSDRGGRVDSKEKGVGAYAAMVARWVETVGADNVVLVEPHDLHTPYYFRSRNVRVVAGATLLANHVIAKLGKEDLVFCRPDAGAQKRMAGLAQETGLPLVDGEKSRAGHDDHAVVKTVGNVTEVEGKKVMIVDDEAATCGTMAGTIEKIMKNGPTEIHVAMSHANMPMDLDDRYAALRRMKDAGAAKVYFLDTQPIGPLPDDLEDFVEVVSAASAIAEELKDV